MISQRVLHAMHRMNLPRMLKAGPENDLQKAIAHVVEAAESLNSKVEFYSTPECAKDFEITNSALRELERALKECGA